MEGLHLLARLGLGVQLLLKLPEMESFQVPDGLAERGLLVAKLLGVDAVEVDDQLLVFVLEGGELELVLLSQFPQKFVVSCRLLSQLTDVLIALVL